MNEIFTFDLTIGDYFISIPLISNVGEKLKKKTWIKMGIKKCRNETYKTTRNHVSEKKYVKWF